MVICFNQKFSTGQVFYTLSITGMTKGLLAVF